MGQRLAIPLSQRAHRRVPRRTGGITVIRDFRPAAARPIRKTPQFD
jgi:hypothetical protein